MAGEALAGIPSEVLRREAALLDEHRRSVREECIGISLELGKHHEIVEEVAAVVEEDPLRERLHGYLMLALYRCGRQAEALEAGRSVRNLLRTELGVDPSQEVQDLEQAILAGESTLPAAGGTQPLLSASGAGSGRSTVVPRQLPASIPDFVGRDEELAGIHRMSAGARDQPGSYAVRIVVLHGPAGMGKSTLGVRAARELSASFPDGQLYADMRSSSGYAGGFLRHFLCAFGVAGDDVPDDVEERIGLYRSIMAARRVLLLFDDVSDEQQVLPLLPGNPDCAVIITSRTRLAGIHGMRGMAVGALEARSSVEFFRRSVGLQRVSAEAQASARLAEMCAGLPLALRILGARLASRPHWRFADMVRRIENTKGRLDEFVHRGMDLRVVIGLSYQRLSTRAQGLFRLLGLVDTSNFPRWCPAALLDEEMSTAGELLEELVDVQLVEPICYPVMDVWRYQVHPLVRRFAVEQLEADAAAERDAAVRRYLGAWMAIVEEAHRSQHGGDFTVVHGQASRWVPPRGGVEQLLDASKWDELQCRSLVAVVRQAGVAGLDELCWDLALTSVTVFETKGYFDDWTETALIARDVAEEAGNRRGVAAAYYSLGSAQLAQKWLSDSEASLRRAWRGFEEAGEVHGMGLVLRNMAFVSRLRGHFELADERYCAALTHLRSAGDEIAEAHVLASVAKLRTDAADARSARGLLERALAICVRLGCVRVEAQVTLRLAELHVQQNELADAYQALYRSLRIVRDIGDRTGESYTLHQLGLVQHLEGRMHNAAATLNHALSLARQVGDRWIMARALAELADVTADQGNHVHSRELRGEADELFAQLFARPRATPPPPELVGTSEPAAVEDTGRAR